MSHIELATDECLLNFWILGCEGIFTIINLLFYMKLRLMGWKMFDLLKLAHFHDRKSNM